MLGLDVKAAEAISTLAAVDAQAFSEIGTQDGLFGIPKDRLDGLLSADAKGALKALKSELNRLKKDAPPKYDVTHSLAEGSSIADMKLFLRGNPETPADAVPRRFLSVLSPENPSLVPSRERPARTGRGRSPARPIR